MAHDPSEPGADGRELALGARVQREGESVLWCPRAGAPAPKASHFSEGAGDVGFYAEFLNVGH